eukprot:Phypoly_transcript_12819.p1 GENE.Phypoly_transcript_12819~~Phypoly_transcript_12819.p1  ORF type:complete len:229 (+),score=29.93 Phypoly_transcript_12819:162-848(+)
MLSQQNFTKLLWESIHPMWEKIIAHPFLTGIADGTLSDDVFQYYVTQDYHYIRDYGKGLSVIAAKAQTHEQSKTFLRHADICFKLEGDLHKEILSSSGAGPDEASAAIHAPRAPNCLLYSSYIMRVAYERPFYEALAAFLPCYWLYWEVGKELKARGPSPNENFQKWIDTYSGHEFAEMVKEVLEIMNFIAQDLSENQRSTLLNHFTTTTKLEYMFWDMSFNKQEWPI